MLSPPPLVFLLDVDNTLLDNDRFAADLRARLALDFGSSECERYWAIYRRRRSALGYADYLGALQDFRTRRGDDPELLLIADFLLDYPFADRVYPQVPAVIAHLHTLGLPVVLSDGDIVFQPRKIRRSGLRAAVEERVMVCVHKERELAAMQRRFPASHYVMVDDKPRLLAAMKRVLGDRLTTVFVRQGHYALAASGTLGEPAPDLGIGRIEELLGFDLAAFRAPACVRQRPTGDPS